jgi:ubiquinone/menaquinone biosynthesis C-methylase UbiE
MEDIEHYWGLHTLGLQYVTEKEIEIGSRAFFSHIRPWMSPFKFPWLMERIKRESNLLRGKHLLEIGCGMGFVSLEFLKRGVRVTATDLTPRALELTRRHLELEAVTPEAVQAGNALELPFNDNTFDAVWANGVLHHTGDTQRAIDEVYRVLKPSGRAIISHFYRRPSWMYLLHRLARENIEFKDEDPPVTDFLSEKEILAMFAKYEVIEAVPEHYRMLPIARRGFKAVAYTVIAKPVYNLLPKSIAKHFAYKFSLTALKR